MQALLASNKTLRTKALQSEKLATHREELLKNVGQISLLMSFKLADLVNIALEEGLYFKSQEWCEKHKGSYLVEHS